MVYTVVKKVSVGIFIKHYLGKRIFGDTPVGSSVPPRNGFQDGRGTFDFTSSVNRLTK